MNRGAGRHAVFHAADDGRAFEALLGIGVARLQVEVHAYCLMTNHFHLLLHCPGGGLSDFMQLVGARYTRHLNDRLGRDGPIFRGRFRSILIDSDRYLAAAGRYIHRNPKDVGPDIDLARYRWSSFRHYCDPVDRPSWLTLDSLMPGAMSSDGYRRLVDGDLGEPCPVSVGWAIRTAINEMTDAELVRAGFERTVGAVMLERAEPHQVDDIESWLSFPNDDARRAARSRTRRRCDQDPAIIDIAERALTLLGLRARTSGV